MFAASRKFICIDFRAYSNAGVAHARLRWRLFEAASRGRGGGGGGEQLCRLEQPSGHGVAQTGGASLVLLYKLFFALSNKIKMVVLRIRIRAFVFGLLDPDPLVRFTDSDPSNSM
jgi:hypothetical protein